MTNETSIIEFGSWLESPAGSYLRDWELAHLDRVVADIFGFHALQLGLPGLDTLRANRMPHRWIGHDRCVCAGSEKSAALAAFGQANSARAASLHCLPEALPFPADSLDLVVLPHTLELAQDPHLALAEVVRVLRPEGRVVVTGLNPVSLWGLRQKWGRMQVACGAPESALFVPEAGEFLGYWRIRDWLRLLGLDLELAQLGCYRPPFSSPAWLHRWAWMESLGEKSWPVLGAVYILVAVKRVHGMRLLGLARRGPRLLTPGPVQVANRQTFKNERPTLP